MDDVFLIRKNREFSNESALLAFSLIEICSIWLFLRMDFDDEDGEGPSKFSR